MGQGLPHRMARIERLAPTGWHRYVLLAVARANGGDGGGRDHALSVLLRMVAEDMGGTPEVMREIERAVSPAP